MSNPQDGVAASGILTEAANIVEGARASTHGDKERSFAAIGMMWTAYLCSRKDSSGTTVSAYDVAQMMVLLKIMRAAQGTAVRDHFVDAAGYAAIAGEIGLFSVSEESAGRMATALEAIVSTVTDTGAGARILDLEREIATLQGLVVDGERRLDAAAIAFDAYAMHHHAKSPPDPIKAQRNGNLAAMCNGRAAFGFPARPERLTKSDPMALPEEFTREGIASS